jgi:peptide deformylase
MAILPILTYPDPLLKRISEEVHDFGPELIQLDADMRETMSQAMGVGLAAPQVNRPIRMVLVDLSGDSEKHGTNVVSLVNPRIVDRGGKFVFEEGCLSVLNFKTTITRSKNVKIEAQDLHGQTLTLDLEDYQAVVAQHELDHLDGILFIDRMSPFKREIYLKKLKKMEKQQKEQEEKDAKKNSHGG